MTQEEVKQIPSQGTEEEKKISAMEASIKNYGELSYYYAHSKQADMAKHAIESTGVDPKHFESGETGITKGGEPIKLKSEKEVVESKRITKEMHPYYWSNEDKKFKVYFNLEDASKFQGVNENHAEAHFEPRAFTAKLFAPKINTEFVMEMDYLYRHVIPEKCSIKVQPLNKFTVILWKKKPGEQWFGVCTSKD